ncbi:MAG: ABC transporter permease [Lachnospiraceae bacterium]|nr:ABC transporter permease [Lachnospiraceae bacterium]
MAKYLISRIIRGIVSIAVVVAIIMVMIYGLMDRTLVFASDGTYTKMTNNSKVTYRYSKWEEYGYLDYVPYSDYMQELADSGEIDEETRASAVSIGRTEDKDSELVSEYVAQFTEYYESQGYTVVRLDAVLQGTKKVASGGTQQLFAYRNIPLGKRLLSYFGSIFVIDNVNNVEDIEGERGLTFTWYDPVYGGEKFSPALIGNGTTHKYLVYFDNQFPYFHQNILTIHLGTSYVVNTGVDVFTTMTASQGSYVKSNITYPTGLTESSADDLHTATYVSGSMSSSTTLEARYTDNYTSVQTVKNGMSKMGYSFVIGIIAVIISYGLGIPLGITMARRKDKLVDQIGTVYIIFILAVPSLAYIFLFKAIGGKIGLPTTFDLDSSNKLMYILPIISLALPSIANLMKWLRRYMIDQMTSDYVKFARSGGLSEQEIFTGHVLKNASIPIIHDIPYSVLSALIGAIITERVYSVPGAGNLLTDAINKYDNSVIVGVAMFYAILTVASIIIGDVLMSVVDPRISFSSKNR